MIRFIQSSVKKVDCLDDIKIKPNENIFITYAVCDSFLVKSKKQDAIYFISNYTMKCL